MDAMTRGSTMQIDDYAQAMVLIETLKASLVINSQSNTAFWLGVLPLEYPQRYKTLQSSAHCE
jgi:hypothetical protein